MEFTNDILVEILKKKQYNIVYSKYFYRLKHEYDLEGNRSKVFQKKSDRLCDCMNLWIWNVYHQNKLMDLQKVNRCMDNRFCPNCKKINLASAIHNFSPHFKELLADGYYPYLLTLTIPNVFGDKLRDTIDKMNKSFRKFFDCFSQDIVSGRKGFSERLIKFDAAYKVLEITCNNTTNTYHPHFHIIMFSKEYDEELFRKHFLGPYRRKSNNFSYLSYMDIHCMQIWKMCYDGIRLSVKNFSNMSDNWNDLYLCDIKEMDHHGIYEVMKYTFKDTDIQNYNNFKNIFLALENKRIRQGYGLLYNLKCEEEDGEKQSLEEFLEKKETPEQLLTQEFNSLLTVYHDYRKISRFKAYKELENID